MFALQSGFFMNIDYGSLSKTKTFLYMRCVILDLHQSCNEEKSNFISILDKRLISLSSCTLLAAK